jgi:hypothetical protein
MQLRSLDTSNVGSKCFKTDFEWWLLWAVEDLVADPAPEYFAAEIPPAEPLEETTLATTSKRPSKVKIFTLRIIESICFLKVLRNA